MISTIILTLVLLSILIFIHEFGHFIVSKTLKVPVEEFSIGFGPRILSFNFKGTEFKISAIPFGGYVKIFGEDKEDEHSFWERPFIIKFLILIAGVVFNFLFGYFILFLLFYLFGIVESGPYVDSPPENTPAYNMGFKFGDKILEIDGRKFIRWKDFYAVFQDGDTHRVKILRNKKDTLLLKLYGVWNDTISRYDVGLYPAIFPVVGEIVKGFPAEKAGFQKGDTIIKINDKEIKKWEDIQSAVKESKGREIIVYVKRGGEIKALKVKPVKYDDSYKMGIVADINVIKLPLVSALSYAWDETYFIVYQTIRIIYLLITGKAPVSSIGGPVMIGKVIGETKKSGLSSILFILAFISIELALINLFPFPALDGGHLLIISIEGIIRRRLSFKARTVIQMIGFIILISLAILITIFDIHRLLK